MNNLFVLFLTYAAFLILTIFITNWNISSPSMLFFGSFCIMFVLANIFQWLFDFKIKNETFWIFFVAGIAFFTTEFGYKVLKRKTKKVISCSDGRLQERTMTQSQIIISRGVLYFMAAFMVLFVISAYYRIIINTDSGTWGERVRQYEIAIKSDDYLSAMPTLDLVLEQITRIGKALVHVIVYIIIYNTLACGVKLNQQKMLMAVSALYIPATLFLGGRQASVELILFCGILYLLLQKNVKKRQKIFKFGFIVLTFAIGFIFIFTATASITGDKAMDRNAIQYVATYLCGGMKNFDELIVGNPCTTKYFGQSSFCHFYRFLIQKFHVLPQKEDLSYHAFGFFSDNTITIFGRWYEDFGFIGVLVMTIIVSWLFTWLHEKSTAKQPPNVMQVIYAQQVMALVWASYDDRFASLVSPSNVIMLLIIVLLYRIFIGGGKYRFSFGGKRFNFGIKPHNAYISSIKN